MIFANSSKTERHFNFCLAHSGQDIARLPKMVVAEIIPLLNTEVFYR